MISAAPASAALTLRGCREAHDAGDRAREATERNDAEIEARRLAQLSPGIPAHLIPDGVTPVTAMLQAAHDARPRRATMLDEALRGQSMVFHPIRDEADWTVGGGNGDAA
jgi:hypothetical protein